MIKRTACVAHYNHWSLPQRSVGEAGNEGGARNASITFEGSGRRLSGTSLDVMDNVGCP